jgi:hypothetical protein
MLFLSRRQIKFEISNLESSQLYLATHPVFNKLFSPMSLLQNDNAVIIINFYQTPKLNFGLKKKPLTVVKYKKKKLAD